MREVVGLLLRESILNVTLDLGSAEFNDVFWFADSSFKGG